ncbi:TKL protein kinase [Phytophthora cinnamomi]|uniref:TKL protein kinase n=1 Tax=Phytophthora cinnamomi TaxID=4785 RepID=UPI0035593ACC|nr:TKL protein kinase [Phytophthora cinnamomi]
MEKLIRKELINEGGHGEVYHGLYRGECVAIKVLLPEKRKDMRQTNNFLSEIKMMAMVEHPRIVRFVGVAWDALSDLSAVSEFMPGGDLFPLLLLLNVLPSGGIALANDAVKERVAGNVAYRRIFCGQSSAARLQYTRALQQLRFDRVEHRAQGFDVDKAKIALHVAQALTYLHSLDPVILHRDLKSMTILLSSDWDAKLTDFGV